MKTCNSFLKAFSILFVCLFSCSIGDQSPSTNTVSQPVEVVQLNNLRVLDEVPFVTLEDYTYLDTSWGIYSMCSDSRNMIISGISNFPDGTVVLAEMYSYVPSTHESSERDQTQTFEIKNGKFTCEFYPWNVPEKIQFTIYPPYQTAEILSILGKQGEKLKHRETYPYEATTPIYKSSFFQLNDSLIAEKKQIPIPASFIQEASDLSIPCEQRFAAFMHYWINKDWKEMLSYTHPVPNLSEDYLRECYPEQVSIVGFHITSSKIVSQLRNGETTMVVSYILKYYRDSKPRRGVRTLELEAELIKSYGDWLVKPSSMPELLYRP